MIFYFNWEIIMKLIHDEIAKIENKLVTKKKPIAIVSGVHQCMLCDCSKFKESLTIDICTCGHTFCDHRTLIP